MKKVLGLIMVVCLLLGLVGCASNVPVGREEELSNVSDAEPVGEVEAWVMESKGFSSADESIKKLYNSVTIDGTPLMYIGYQVNPNGIDYAFTVKDADNVKHLYILRQTVDKQVSILKETTDFDLLEYFNN